MGPSLIPGLSLEAECLPLFAAGTVLVLAAEVVIALAVLRRQPRRRGLLLAHALSLAGAFLCLGLMLFGDGTAPDGGAFDSSGRLALFGILWCISEGCALGALLDRK